MKLIDLTVTNFRKLSNLPQPTITFNPDINVLVGANNAGKTSVLKAVQRLFRTEEIEAEKDLNYLVTSGQLIINGTIDFLLDEWAAYMTLAHGLESSLKKFSLENTSVPAYLSFNLEAKTDFVNRQISYSTRYAKFPTSWPPDDKKQSIENFFSDALKHIRNSDFYNVFKTPLFLDSKGELLGKEKFVPLSTIKKTPQGNFSTNIRGLLYALKKDNPLAFADFKSRLLETFTEIADIDVRHNEEEGLFELVIHENLRSNGDYKQVSYDITNVGQGMQSLVLMISSILLHKPSIVLMDEPEVHMHPSLIKEFVKYIKQLSTDTQFIITTHSVVLMNEVGIDKIIALKNEPEQKGIIASKIEDRVALLETVTSLGYNIDALTYTLKPSVFVFTEGPSDKDLIIAFANKAGLASEINSFNTAFIAMGGKGNRYKLSFLIDKLNKDFIDSPLIMILDKDEIAQDEVESVKNKFFKANPKRLHYLSKRQIENYLVDEKGIKAVVHGKLKNDLLIEKWLQENLVEQIAALADLQKENILNNFVSELFINDSLINSQTVRDLIKTIKDKPLAESARDFIGKISGLIAERTFDLGQKTNSATSEFEQKWALNKIEMCDGRELLKSIRKWVADEYKVSFSADELIAEMETIPAEIYSLLQQLTRPEELMMVNK